MTPQEAINNLKKLKSYHNGSYGTAIDLAIKALEQQSKMQDCEHCIHTYGTLGCCDMVNNEWVYDCEFGKEQYKKEHESQPCEDCISRTALLSRIDAERKHLLDIKMDGAEHVIVHHARRIIEDMPSVTPKAESEGEE